MALGQKQKARLEKLWMAPVSGFVLKVFVDINEMKRRKDQTYPVILEARHHQTNALKWRTEVARTQLLDKRKVEEIQAFLKECTEDWLEDYHRYDGW